MNAEVQGPVPLFVGVTGHRDIPPSDAARLAIEVSDRLRRMMRDYPHTKIVVLSALAEGADRIVAAAAVALHLELVVPLPMAPEEYRRDCTSRDSLDEFESLLSAARYSFVVPVPHAQPSREDRYEALGAFIADASDLLIALWDGRPSQGRGGTADIVEFRRSGIPHHYGGPESPLDRHAAQPVHWIVVSRNGAAESTAAKTPDAAEAASSAAGEPVWGCIDEFNKDALEELPRSSGVDSATFYEIADRLAIRFRRELNRSLDCTFAFIAAAVLALEAYALDLAFVEHPGGVPPLFFLLANIISAGAAFAVVSIARRKRFESKSQDYRALSEALRIHTFWQKLRLSDHVGDHYLRKQQGELQWIRKALRSTLRYAHFGAQERGGDGPSADLLRSLRESWILGQQRFFARSAERDDRKAQMAKRASAQLIIGSTLLTLTLAGIELVSLRSAPPPLTRELSLFAITTMAAFAALIHSYAEKSAWSYHAREYERMHKLYDDADAALLTLIEPGAEKTQQARTLLFDLGREALSENGDWLLAHRARPIEIPDT